jgi:hypothetical protein
MLKYCDMKNIFAVFIILLSTANFSRYISAQPVVGLDNWFNRETNAKTGLPFHYLWTDTEDSGYSEWGEIFKNRGAAIRVVERPDAATLAAINVYIIVDPDTTTENKSPNYITSSEAKTIAAWVRNGGVLAILANDGPNCEFTNLNKFAARFGITFNHVTLHKVTGSDWETGACINLPAHPLFKGVSKIYIKEISDINLKGKAKAVLTENGKVLIAECNYGKGYVFAIGDPWIYNEYIGHSRLTPDFDNRKAAENLTDLLLGKIRK